MHISHIFNLKGGGGGGGEKKVFRLFRSRSDLLLSRLNSIYNVWQVFYNLITNCTNTFCLKKMTDAFARKSFSLFFFSTKNIGDFEVLRAIPDKNQKILNGAGHSWSQIFMKLSEHVKVVT